jgi:CAAX protease family protein
MNADEPNPTLSPESQNSAGAPSASAPQVVRDDLRVPWNWRDLIVFGAFALAATILLTLLVEGIFVLCGVRPAQIRQSPGKESYLTLAAQTLIFGALLAFLATQLRLRVRAPFWRTIGWRRLDTGGRPPAVVYLGILATGFVFAAVIEIASGLIGTKGPSPIEKLFQDRGAAILLMLMAVLIAPVIEETIFRGYIYPALARRFGIPAGVIATGILFGMLHGPQLWPNAGQIALMVVVGMVFTAARAITGTVVASYLLHVSYNSFVSLAFFVASHGLRHLPPGT